MTMSKLNSPEEVNFICSRMSLLGRHNHEWLDVSKATPTVRKKSKCFLSRFWKPTNLRLVPSFNKTLEFFKANKDALLNPKYVEKNKEGLRHVVGYFSTKKDMRLKIQEFQSLIDELIPPPISPTITPEMIIADAKSKALQIIEDAKQNAIKAKIPINKTYQELTAKLKEETEVTDKLEKTIDEKTKTIKDKLENIPLVDITKSLMNARLQTILKKDLCDVILTTKDGNEIQVHAAFLRKGLKDPKLVEKATKDKPIRLDLFNEYNSNIVQIFCNQLYSYDKPVNASRLELVEYLDFLTSHPDINVREHISVFNNSPRKTTDFIPSCVNVLRERIEKSKSSDALFLVNVLLSLLNRSETNKELLKFDLIKIIADKISSFPLQLTLFERIKIFILISAGVSQVNHEYVLPLLKDLAYPADDFHNQFKYKHLYNEFILCLKKFVKYPSMKGVCAILLINNPSASDQEKEEAVKYLTEAYEGGDLDAGYQLAECYLNGTGVKADDKKALDLFFELKDKGHPNVEKTLLGMCLDLEKMDKRSFNFLLQSAQSRTDIKKIIYVRIAQCYRDGNGVTQDYSEAVNLFRKWYDFGGASKDELYKHLATIPIEFFNGLANVGDEENAKYMLDRFASKTSLHKHLISSETIKWLVWRSAKISIDPSYSFKAKLILGICYTEGWGMEQNEAAGLNMIQEALKLLTDLNNSKKITENELQDLRNIFIARLVEFYSKNQKISKRLISSLFKNVEILEKFKTQESIKWILEWADDANLQSQDKEIVATCLQAKWLEGELTYRGNLPPKLFLRVKDFFDLLLEKAKSLNLDVNILGIMKERFFSYKF